MDRLLNGSSKRFLLNLRNAIIDKPDEIIEYIDNVLGINMIETFIDKHDVEGWTSAAAYELYCQECNDKGTEPIHLNDFSRIIQRLTGYHTKTVRIDNTTRRLFKR